MIFKQWNVGTYDEVAAKSLAEKLKISELSAIALCARGIGNAEKAKEFLRCELDGLYDPLLLDDMDKAIERIRLAIKNNEKITIFGDYDVDGVTSTVVLVDFLQNEGANVGYYIPDRLNEGYGLNTAALTMLAENGTKLIITVDCGITAVDETEFARSCGMEVIVCDHHMCRGELPNAVAVIDAHREGSKYPFAELAGVGAVFKLVCALAGPARRAEMIEKYLYLAAMGTIADVMQMTDENRVIVFHGLRRLAVSKNPGLRALLRSAGADNKPVTAQTVGFVIAPRINALGRLGNAMGAVELFLTESNAVAERRAAELYEHNRERQATDGVVYSEAMTEMETQYNPDKQNVAVLAHEGWHHGVMGIVASRICERLYRPTILVSVDGEYAKGSGRSVPGVNLFDALESCTDVLERFGGHELAAGLTLRTDRIDEFRDRLNAAVEKQLCGRDLSPSIDVDAVIDAKLATYENVYGLYVLEPHGTGNTKPIFAIENATIINIQSISDGHHIKFTLRCGGRDLGCVMFGQPITEFPFANGAGVDVAATLDLNTFRDETSVQLLVKDVRPCRAEREKTGHEIDAWKKFQNGGEPIGAIIPGREQLALVWNWVKSRATDDYVEIDPRLTYLQISDQQGRLNAGQTAASLAIFTELALLTRRGNFYRVAGNHRVELNHSAVYRRLNGIAQ